MEGREGELPAEDAAMPDADADADAPMPQQPEEEHEQMWPVGVPPGGGGEQVVAMDVPCFDVEEERFHGTRQEVAEEGEGGALTEVVEEEEGLASAGVEVAEEEVERGSARAEGADEVAVSHGMEVGEEGVAVPEIDDEQLPELGSLPYASDVAEGNDGASTVGAFPLVVDDMAEGNASEEQLQHEEEEEEEERGAEVAEVEEEKAVSHGMEADDEVVAYNEIENARAPSPSDFVAAADEKEEAASLGHFPAAEDDAIVDDDGAEEDEEEEEEEEEEAASAMALEEKELTAAASGGRSRGGGRKKRGRPPKTQASRLPTKKKEEEDLCFICFDGGNLVVCDRRGCPKVYHPACVNRDESFFRSKGRWNCGWHICSVCEKAAHYMCFTCTYSLCKTCIKEAGFVCVRGNKGFCETCRSTVILIETDEEEKKKTAGVDFDDRNSWMYLFKDYWLDLKRKLSITLEEISRAKNPWKGPSVRHEESSDELYDAKEDPGSSSDSSSARREGNKPARKKVRRRSKAGVGDEEPVKLSNTEGTHLPDESEWASGELLEFVAHMRNGDKSAMCQFDVHTLLLEYIKRNNLRDPRRKSQIICDSRLEKLFGKARVGHFEMLKLLESHFLLKETSQAVTDDNQGGVVDPEFSQLDTEGNSEVVPKSSSDKKRRSRKRIEEREPQNNLDDYAAIDIHNISLIYLRRNLMEELLDDTENFNDKVVGSFVRIRISGAGQRQDMYRLVQVIGTGKAAEKYKTGKKTTDITLEILNLSKTESISIDSISNQEFTEEECERLRQSIKCGLINRLTVRDVLEKAMALQAVRVSESLENEKLRLSHLRDRASEKGRRKELRECVEKLQLLNSPEERSRRLNDVPEVHADPHMDPNYESAEEEFGDKKQDNFIRSTESKFARVGREPNSSLKGNLGSTDSWGGSRRGSTASWESSKNLSTRGGWDKVDPSSGSIDRVNEVTLNQSKDLYQANSWDTSKSLAGAAVTDTGVWSNGQGGMRPGQSSCLSSETSSTSQCTETVILSNINENEKMWHYQDPSGKIQGPFSMTQLRKWSTTGYFPANLRIWKTSEKQEESILLTDALIGKFQKEPPPPEMQHGTLTQVPKVAQVMDAREDNYKSNWRANNNSWPEKKKDDGNLSCNETNISGTTNLGVAKADGWTGHSSGWSSPKMGPVAPRERMAGGSSRMWESSKETNAWASQPQVHDAPPPPAAPFSVNSYQPSAHQGRGWGGSAGRWKGGRSQGNTRGSSRPAAFHPSGYGYERQHSTNYVYPGHQSPGETWKVQAASNPNHWGNDSLNLPTPTPRPGGGWMGGHQSSASPVSVQSAVSGWASTVTQGGNNLQFPSVPVNEAQKNSAWVEQPPSTVVSSWGPSPSLLSPTEMAASWGSSAAVTIPVAKETVLADGSFNAHAPGMQNLPSISNGQNILAHDSAPEAPFKVEAVKAAGGITDCFVSTVTPSDSQKNRHMKDDCPSPTPKDEQVKFGALISVSSQQNNVDVDTGKSFKAHNSFPVGSPIKLADSVQYDATAASPSSMQMPPVLAENLEVNKSSYTAASTGNSLSSNEMMDKNPVVSSDDLESLSSQKQVFEPSDHKYSFESQEKASDLSLRQETDSLVQNLAHRGDGLEQPQSQNPRVHVLEPAISGNLGLPADRAEWSMPSPTPTVEPSGSHAGVDSAIGVCPSSSAQWGSSVHLDPVSLSNAGQGTGNMEIKHVGVGMSQENINKGVEQPKESGHIDLGETIQGTTNASMGTVVPGNPGGTWSNPPQGNANVNVGWATPAQGNANMNMFWVALTQANAGWGNPVQGNPNPNAGWVYTAPTNTPAVSGWGAVAPQGNATANQNWGAPVQGNANAVAGWVTPQSNSNPNAGWFGQGNISAGGNTLAGNTGSWGAQQKHNAEGYPGHDDRGFQNNDAGHGAVRHGWNRSHNGGGGGGPSRAPPRGPTTGICKFHESGHCKKGARCNFLHT